ncbi:SpoIIE family protein phosphatase [Actinoplanes missouriensis]|uniref:SpoIIE family protein phosphatase n=1 Tax=Actinoplanes missouriensis TaxID=1866 RepID=UPI0033CDDB4C
MPDPVEWLAALDADPQGWALATAVRADGGAGEIVDFELRYVNEAGARLTGRTRAELIGGRYRELWPETVHDGTLPLYRTVVETRQPVIRTVYYDKSSIAGHFDMWIGPHDDGFLVRFVDLRRVTMAPLSAGGARLYDVLNAMFDGFTLLRAVRGGDGRITDFVCEHVNETGAAATGHTVEELIGRPLSVINGRSWENGLFERYAAVAETGVAWRHEMPYPAIGQVWEIKAGRAGTDFVAVSFRDITEQVEQRRAVASIAAALQQALLPATLPPVPGVRHAARYLPWTQGLDVGGDWYDVIAIADDVVGVVIGDVAGHNTSAAAAMGQVRNALRAYAVEGHDPAGVLHHANQLLCDMHLETLATCCYLELHPAEGTATAVLAGHPPPMLRTAGGTGPVPLRCGPPLGVTRHAAYSGTTFLVPPGSTLLLYTDGLVEGSRHPIDRGMAELCDAVAAAPHTDPERILDHVLAEPVGPRPRSDDVAVLCLTNDTVPQAQLVRRRFRGEALSASTARRFTSDMLAAWDLTALLEDALLMLGELITNAIQHTVGDVVVELRRDEALRIAVSDPSNRLPVPRTPGPESENGRGLLIVERLAAGWGTAMLPAGGKQVWFELPLP